MPDPVLTTDPTVIAEMRKTLRSAAFSEASLYALIGRDALEAARAGDLAGAMRATKAVDPLGTLARLFVLGVEVEERAAARALGPSGVDGWTGAGLLLRSGAGVVARLRLFPVVFGDTELIVAYDVLGPAADADAVLGVGPTAEALAGLTIRVPSRRGLDLGCGGGIQALLLAHRRSVIPAMLSTRRRSVMLRPGWPPRARPPRVTVLDVPPFTRRVFPVSNLVVTG